MSDGFDMHPAGCRCPVHTPATGEGDREALAELLRGRLTGFAAADAVLAAGFRRAGSGEARLTEAEPGALPLTDNERRHGQVLDGVLLFHEVAVGRILADRAAEENDLRAAVLALAEEFNRRQARNASHNGGVSCSVWGLAGGELRRAVLAATGGDDDDS